MPGLAQAIGELIPNTHFLSNRPASAALREVMGHG
jgi:hypothetical protein